MCQPFHPDSVPNLIPPSHLISCLSTQLSLRNSHISSLVSSHIGQVPPLRRSIPGHHQSHNPHGLKYYAGFPPAFKPRCLVLPGRSYGYVFVSCGSTDILCQHSPSLKNSRTRDLHAYRAPLTLSTSPPYCCQWESTQRSAVRRPAYSQPKRNISCSLVHIRIRLVTLSYITFIVFCA